MAEPGEGLRYRRVLLKISGEALAGDRGFGIDANVVDHLTDVSSQVFECLFFYIYRSDFDFGAGDEKQCDGYPQQCSSTLHW